MLTKRILWNLPDNHEKEIILKYCPHCGYLTKFKDSNKIRRNANGKNIYEFAIYKCKKEHTWNRKTGIYKAESIKSKLKDIIIDLKPDALNKGRRKRPEPVKYLGLINSEIDLLEIEIGCCMGRWRLDKLLSKFISDCSRSQIKKKIQAGEIKLNGKSVKPGIFITQPGVISILICHKET